jgi:hypothetical protein
LQAAHDKAAEFQDSQNELVESATRPVEEEMVDYTALPTHMDINMVYYLLAEFRAVDED